MSQSTQYQLQDMKVVKEEDKEVIEQLQKTKANISIWGLLMASSGHREAVLAELNAAHVPTTITPEELAGTVAQVRKLNLMTFSDKDLPSEGKGHNQALQITIGCNGYWVPHVLINNGSGVNICTLDTAKMIGVTEEIIALGNDTTRIVRGFDNKKKNVMGEFSTVLMVGPIQTKTTFLVMDIKANFSIGSTLHQKLKFVWGDKVIIIYGDNDPEETDVNNKNQIIIPVIETDQGRKNYGEESVNLVVYRTPSKEKLPSWFDHGHVIPTVSKSLT
ncbi:hypothetical protein BVC80_7257g4 [Macleaya cordata]|uniref:Uncharacterized protein n=1 Tax=Macleaya cordata TaxID=56857 RepID=A0A200R8J7_MACCD|nr:hypothetical protein BVC80_7257g4 [Macleaya cordata]